MKNYVIALLFTLLLAGTQICFSQPYKPLPETNASWIVYEADSENIIYTEFYLSTTIDDTIINENVFNKIHYRIVSWPNDWNKNRDQFKDGDNILSDELGYYGAFRNTQDGKVFFVPNDPNPIIASTEFLVVDFTKNEGDTVYNVGITEASIFYISDFIVDSIRYKPAGPHSLKCLFLSPRYLEYPCLQPHNCQLVWIEGIGSTNGGILNSVSAGFLNYYMNCMHKEDTMYYYNDFGSSFFGLTYEPGICALPVDIKTRKDSYNQLVIYPNPASNWVSFTYTLVGEKPVGVLEMRDAAGRSVHQAQLSQKQGEYVWDTRQLKVGTYFYSLKTGGNVKTGKLIITK